MPISWTLGGGVLFWCYLATSDSGVCHRNIWYCRCNLFPLFSLLSYAKVLFWCYLATSDSSVCHRNIWYDIATFSHCFFLQPISFPIMQKSCFDVISQHLIAAFATAISDMALLLFSHCFLFFVIFLATSDSVCHRNIWYVALLQLFPIVFSCSLFPNFCFLSCKSPVLMLSRNIW